jgi:hypothetical protein
MVEVEHNQATRRLVDSVCLQKHFPVKFAQMDTMMAEQQEGPSKQQQQHFQSQQTKGTRSFRGVYKCGKRFKAQLQCGGVQFYLGTFDTEEDAAKAYDKKCREEKGMRGLTNFDDTGHLRTTAGSMSTSDDTSAVSVASGDKNVDAACSSSSSSVAAVAPSSSSSTKSNKRVAVDNADGVSVTGATDTGSMSLSSGLGRTSMNSTGYLDKNITPLDPQGHVNVHVATEANGLQVEMVEKRGLYCGFAVPSHVCLLPECICAMFPR